MRKIANGKFSGASNAMRPGNSVRRKTRPLRIERLFVAMPHFAPAKINLSLRVLGRRADGFHEIETLMAPIALGDDLDIEPADGEIAFACDDPGIPGDETNLVVRAARLFFEQTGRKDGARITLSKKTPHGAGLGGGSSDAATTLLALDSLFEAGLGVKGLAEMAAVLGSDVPFFLHRSAAICRGRGELVEAVDFPYALPLLLLKPPFGVPTPWAYSRWAESREIPGVDYKAQEFPWGKWVNDLERPVFEKFIFLAHLKSWLREQPEVSGALMSGSGSTTIALLRNAESADALGVRAREQFGETLWTCFTRTCSSAPSRIGSLSDSRPIEK